MKGVGFAFLQLQTGMGEVAEGIHQGDHFGRVFLEAIVSDVLAMFEESVEV